MAQEIHALPFSILPVAPTYTGQSQLSCACNPPLAAPSNLASLPTPLQLPSLTVCAHPRNLLQIAPTFPVSVRPYFYSQGAHAFVHPSPAATSNPSLHCLTCFHSGPYFYSQETHAFAHPSLVPESIEEALAKYGRSVVR